MTKVRSAMAMIGGADAALGRCFRLLMVKDIWLYLCAGLSVFLLAARTPFDRVLREDAYHFVVKGMEIMHGDFSLDQPQAIGWPLILGAIFSFLEVSDLFEAMFIARWTSIVCMALCVLVLGKLCTAVFGCEGLHAVVVAIVLAFLLAPLNAFAARNAMTEPSFVLSMLVMTMFLVKAWTTDRTNLRYIALAALAAALSYYIRPNGLFLFAAMLSTILLISYTNMRALAVLCVVAVGVFLLITLPYLHARYAAFGSPLDYGPNSKYFVDHYEQVWADNVAAPSLLHYLQTHDWGDYYLKFISGGLLEVLALTAAHLLPWLWIALSSAGAVAIFLLGRKRLYFVPLAMLVSVMGLALVFHIFGSVRHLIYFLPLLLIMSGASLLLLKRYQVDARSIVGACLIAFTVAGASEVAWLNPNHVVIPQVKDHWAVWAADNLYGNIAIIEGGDILEMSQHYESRGWRIAKDFANVKRTITPMRPGIHDSLGQALAEFKQKQIRYVITDAEHIKRRSYLRDVSNPEWQGAFKHLMHFRLGYRGAVLTDVDIYEVVY